MIKLNFQVSNDYYFCYCIFLMLLLCICIDEKRGSMDLYTDYVKMRPNHNIKALCLMHSENNSCSLDSS